jgi:DNA mismatch repair protein MutL
MNMTSYELDQNKSKIKILPDHLIDQIKAGEVVERPSSALKELLENALDAGSTEIKIHLKENGLELIQIEDNGHGMSYEELPFAFYRHATSKLKRFDDLFHLSSFGFRGEALASIASSAKISCLTFPATPNLEGGQIELNGGHIAFYQKVPPKSESGTSIFVRELFYNTPARLKFLNSKTSEKTYLTKLLEAFMLSHPKVSFTLRFDDQDKKVFKSASLMDRVRDFYLRKDFETEIPELSQDYQGYKTTIYLIPEIALRPGKKRHFVFINNRIVQDPYFFQICKRYLEQAGLDKNMSFILFIESPKTETDVNVHPNKTKIKIHQLSVISSLLHSLFKKLKPQNRSQSESTIEAVEEGKTPLALKSRDLSSALRKYDSDSNNHAPSYPLQDNQCCPHFIFDIRKSSLINFKLFLKCFLLKKFSDKEFQLIPLLISERISLESQRAKSIDRLKTLGFELEFEDEEIYLKTIPQFLDIFKTSAIARFVELISTFEWNKQGEFIECLRNLKEEQFNLLPSWNDHYYNLPYQNDLDQTQYIRIVSQSDWQLLWNL